MEKEFVPYELALKLKELGFDEECWFKYNHNKEFKLAVSWIHNSQSDDGQCSALLWQQAFDWIREKHKIIYNITFKDDNYKFSYGNINSATNLYTPQYPTYEEAREECLKKLIKIVEND